MSELRAHGITVSVPPGWDGRIRSRADGAGGLRAAAVGEQLGLPVAQLASFRLPAETGDFGSGAVEGMGPSDIFVSLLEFGDEVSGTPLYRRQGMPRLRPDAFTPSSMQRTIAGQCGTQAFFSVGHRAFCAYAVLGRARDVGPLVATVNDLLQRIVVEAHPAGDVPGDR